MAVITIDAKGELEEYIAQQRDIPADPPPPPAGVPAKPNGAPAPAKEAPASTPAEKPKTPTRSAADPEPDDGEDQDDIEGEDGLTLRQKRELSAKMLKAIGKKHRQVKEAEEFAAAQYSEKRMAEARAEALQREVEQLKGAQPTKTETIDPETGKPKREAYGTDQEYWDAYVDWRAERKADAKIKEKEVADAKAAAERQTAEVLETARGRIGRALEIVPDFKAVTEAVDLEVPPIVAGYMQKSEMFAELGYHLAKHPEVLARLAKLPPDEQLVTIGKIEGTLKPFEPQGSKSTNGATPSKAANGSEEPSETGSTPSRARGTAPVITPINGGSGVLVEPDVRNQSTRQRIEAWQRQHKVNIVGLRKRH